MSKEKILELDNFRDENGQSFRGLLNAVGKKHSNIFFGEYSKDFEYRRLVNFINSFNKKSIDQTREETIRECEGVLPERTENDDVSDRYYCNQYKKEIKQLLINLRK